MRPPSCSSERCRPWPVAAILALCLSLQPHPVPAGDLYGEVLAVPPGAEARESFLAPSSDAALLRPLPNQMIELCGEDDGSCERQFTDGAGYYQFDDLESGTYTLKIPGSDGRLLEREVTVDRGSARQLRILAR